MFHPAFLDDVIFALEMDGSCTSLFMIDEKNTSRFQPKTLTELSGYFNKKEDLLIEEEQNKQKRIEAEIKRKKEEKERLEKIETLYGRVIETLADGLSIRYNGTSYYITYRDRVLSGQLDKVFCDSLYLNCFITARISNELVFFFWDKDHIRLPECFRWKMEGDMFYRFEDSRWIYGGDSLHYYHGAYDRGRLVNGSICMDILQKESRYSIVKSEIIGNPNPVPTNEVKKSILYYFKRQIWWVIVIYLFISSLLIDELSWKGFMDSSLLAIPILIPFVLGALLVSWMKTPYRQGIDGKYYLGETPHLSSSTVIWAQECD